MLVPELGMAVNKSTDKPLQMKPNTSSDFNERGFVDRELTTSGPLFRCHN